MNLKTLFNKIIYILIPQKCLACGKLGEIICDNCLYKLPKESNIYGINTIFSYSDPTIRRAIWLLKYKGIREVAKPLAKITYEKLLEDLSSLAELLLQTDSKIVIIPTPLSKEREKERGYNQSTIIAEELIKLDAGRSFELRTDILIKNRHTPSQVSIKNRTERLKNLNKVFSLQNKDAIKNKIVVILDDVTTTGTTLNECAKTLRHSRPRQIIKLAIRH